MGPWKIWVIVSATSPTLTLALRWKRGSKRTLPKAKVPRPKAESAFTVLETAVLEGCGEVYASSQEMVSLMLECRRLEKVCNVVFVLYTFSVCLALFTF